MRGPVAPKDPAAKRQGFYIMKNKGVCGSPSADGRGICEIYEDMGRMETSAKLDGNITDENILAMLSTAEGFKKLVHSIGVSVNAAGVTTDVDFVFQIYGKTDTYKSGTTLTITIPADGMEYVMDLQNVDYSDDDDVPGQLRFEFPKPDIVAEVSVILYVNDGYEVPEQLKDDPVDTTSDAYKAIIEKSLIQKGNTYRIRKALEKARKGEDVTVAFIGGSITQGAGAVPINKECYAYKIFKGFCDLAGKSTDENIHYIKAGVGGTPSELGILRYDVDVLLEGKVEPDLVVVEFAVNDEGDETGGEFYDSLVRRIYNGPGNPAVILLFAVFANDWNLEERLCIVGEQYKLPMVSTRRSVVEQFRLTKDQGNVLSKSQFFYDLFHPTNIGHTIMADGVLHLLDVIDGKVKAPENTEAETETAETPTTETNVTDADNTTDISITDIPAPKGSYFENVIFMDRTHPLDGVTIDEGLFTGKDVNVHYVERNMDTALSPVLPDNWFYNGAKNPADDNPVFRMNLKCRSLMVIYLDSGSADVGTADVYVDGQKMLHLDPHEVGWTHSTPKIVFRNDESADHVIEIIADKDRDFTIQGFGILP